MKFYADFNDYVIGERERLDQLSKTGMPEKAIIKKVLYSNPQLTKEEHLGTYSVTQEVEALEVSLVGIVNSRHHGLERKATGRDKELFPVGTHIRNHRHLFAISTYDCQQLTKRIGKKITPELLGANLLIDAEEAFSLTDIPQGTYLIIADKGANECPKPPQTPHATLRHYAKQEGCGKTGAAIAHAYDDTSLIATFLKESKHNRGITLSIEQLRGIMTTITKEQEIYFKYPTGVSI